MCQHCVACQCWSRVFWWWCWWCVGVLAVATSKSEIYTFLNNTFQSRNYIDGVTRECYHAPPEGQDHGRMGGEHVRYWGLCRVKDGRQVTTLFQRSQWLGPPLTSPTSPRRGPRGQVTGLAGWPADSGWCWPSWPPICCSDWSSPVSPGPGVRATGASRWTCWRGAPACPAWGPTRPTCRSFWKFSPNEGNNVEHRTFGIMYMYVNYMWNVVTNNASNDGVWDANIEDNGVVEQLVWRQWNRHESYGGHYLQQIIMNEQVDGSV